MPNWYSHIQKQAQVAQPIQPVQQTPDVAPVPQAGTPNKSNTTPDDAAEQLRTEMHNLLRQNVLPTFIKKMSTSVSQLVNSELAEFNTLLSSQNIDFRRVDTFQYLCLVANAVISQYAMTKNPDVTNKVMNDRVTSMITNALVNAHSPDKTQMGQAALRRGIQQSRPKL